MKYGKKKKTKQYHENWMLYSFCKSLLLSAISIFFQWKSMISFDFVLLVILFWKVILKQRKKIHVGQNIPHNLKFKYKSDSLISFPFDSCDDLYFLVFLWFIIVDVIIIALIVNLVVLLIQINFFDH